MKPIPVSVLAAVAAAGWAAAWVGTSGWLTAQWLGTGILVLVVLLWWLFRTQSAGAVALVGVGFVVVALLAGARTWQQQSSLPAQWAQQHRTATLSIKLATEPRLVAGDTAMLIQGKVTEIAVPGHRLRTNQPIVAFARNTAEVNQLQLQPGATYQIGGRLSPGEPGDRAALVVSVQEVGDEISPPWLGDRMINGLRQGMHHAMSRASPNQAALVPSMVIGDTSKIDPQVKQDFQATSLSHLMAVSGSNLTLTLGLVFAVARVAGLHGWRLQVLSALAIAGFVVLCRMEPSVIRAAAMAIVVLLGSGMGRVKPQLRNISLAVVALMLVDPWLARSFGFALSVSACLGITLLAQRWVSAISSWAPLWLAEAAAVPAAAQLATTPIIVWLSGQISVVGVLANMAAGPFVAPVTILGLAAMLTGIVAPVSALLGWLAGWCSQPILWISQLGASLPGAAITWPTGVMGVLLSALLVGLIALAVTRWAKNPILVTLLIVVLVLFSVWRPRPFGQPTDWQVTFCDVGQGDAALLRAGPASAVVVDTGPEPQAMLACMDQLGIESVPLLVLSHFHADHTGAAAEVIRNYQPEIIVVSPYANPSAEELAGLATTNGSSWRVSKPGDSYRVGDVTWETIGAWAAGEGDEAPENDSSVVGLAVTKDLKVLFTGDIELAGQRRILPGQNGLAVDIFKVPHHGSATQVPALFEAVEAQVAVVSCGVDNDYGHPAAKTLQLVQEQGMRVYRTDESGTLVFARRDGRLVSYTVKR